MATKKTAKKTAKKITKKANKKVTASKSATAVKKKAVSKKVVNKQSKKTTKKVAKKVARKVTKKVAKKTSAKKATAKKTTSKKTSTKQSVQQSPADHIQNLLLENLNGLSGDKAEALAKNIWLAGLGAYSRTFNEVSGRVDELQERYDSINAEGQKIFEQLVKRGVSMQADVEQAVREGKDTIEERVEEFKQRFGGGLTNYVDIPGRLRDAAEKIEQLSDRLQKKK